MVTFENWFFDYYGIDIGFFTNEADDKEFEEVMEEAFRLYEKEVQNDKRRKARVDPRYRGKD